MAKTWLCRTGPCPRASPAGAPCCWCTAWANMWVAMTRWPAASTTGVLPCGVTTSMVTANLVGHVAASLRTCACWMTWPTWWTPRAPAVVAAYLADPLCHDRISARLARFIANGGPATVARAAHWSVPTLLMWAGSDKLVHPAGSRAFAAAAPKAVVHAHCFEPLFHELFNESPELAEPVFNLLQQWLVRRCPAVR